MKLYERIRQIIEATPGLTQKGLALAMGVNPAAVNRMLKGARFIKAHEIPSIQQYLGVSLHLPPFFPEPEPAVAAPFSPVKTEPGNKVPVFGSADGNPARELSLDEDEVIDYVVRHPGQGGTLGFAFYVSSDNMQPRYFPGELVYAHPKPPEPGRDFLIKMASGQGYLYRFMGVNGDKIRVAQFNPPQELEIPRKDIVSVYSVVGRG